MKSLKHTLLLTFLLSVGVGTAGQTASFDCSKARSETEKAICADKNLSLIDEELFEAYKNYIPTGQEYTPILESMAKWREARDRCGTNPTCIEQVYKEWIFALQQNYIKEQLAEPRSFDSNICMFAAPKGDLSSSKIYSCFDTIYNLDAPTATACHVSNNVYRIIDGDSLALEHWDNIVNYLSGIPPTISIPIGSISAHFGRDHFNLGCDLHSCISVEVATPDGDNLASPGFYFFFGLDGWKPTSFPPETMFIFSSSGKSYPDVKFCRFLK